MQITTAQELQTKFKSGITICGEQDNEFQWIGTDKQWALSDLDLSQEVMSNEEVEF